MHNSFATRFSATLAVWLVGLVMWLLMIAMFVDHDPMEQIRHVAATIGGLADSKLCAAQLIGVCVLAAATFLLDRRHSPNRITPTQELYLSETLTVCLNFSVVFGLAMILGIVALFLDDPSLKQIRVVANGIMMLLNGGIAYLLWGKIKSDPTS